MADAEDDALGLKERFSSLVADQLEAKFETKECDGLGFCTCLGHYVDLDYPSDLRRGRKGFIKVEVVER